jgi:hypothetical protein
MQYSIDINKINRIEIQGIIRDYIENLYSNELGNLEEMDKFIDTFDHTKLNQEDINHLSRSITSNKKEGAIKNLPKIKLQDLKNCLMNSTRPLKNSQYQHSLNFSTK